MISTLSNKNKKIIIKVHTTNNRIFLIFLKTKALLSLKGIVNNNYWLQHFCSDHLNFHGLKLLAEKNIVIRLPMTNISY